MGFFFFTFLSRLCISVPNYKVNFILFVFHILSFMRFYDTILILFQPSFHAAMGDYFESNVTERDAMRIKK